MIHGPDIKTAPSTALSSEGSPVELKEPAGLKGLVREMLNWFGSRIDQCVPMKKNRLKTRGGSGRNTRRSCWR